MKSLSKIYCEGFNACIYNNGCGKDVKNTDRAEKIRVGAIVKENI